ncbi:hypothetical protein HYT53_00495 [Candidatus Woesearchaeota archaeon]|nr:hypothetical protein [Candidatus Woesearchaeota archaeon]
MLVYWFLPMILLLGIVTSYEDIKFGKIRNKWVLMAIAYSVIAYASLLLLGNAYGLTIDSIFRIAFNGLWRAGDAKLFFAFAVLVPIRLKGFSPFFIILAATFVPVMVYFLAQIFLKMGYKEKISHFKRALNPKNMLRIALFIFGVSWLAQISLNSFGLRGNIFLLLLIMYLLYNFVEKVLRFDFVYIAFAVSLARILFDKSIYTFSFLPGFLALLLLFLIVRVFVVSMGMKYFSNEVQLSQLREGMIPAEVIYFSKGKYFKRMKSFSIIGEAKAKGGLLFNPNALGKNEIKRLKSLQRRLPFGTLRIQSTMPFAPFLFSGVLLTIILRLFGIFI